MNSESGPNDKRAGECVIDAGVVLAAIFKEPGAAVAEDLLPRSLVLSVNYGEVAKRMVAGEIPFGYTKTHLERLGLNVVSYDAELALLAASLYPIGKPLGLSLGDRACLALAVQRQLPVYTTERRWPELKLPVEVHVIR